MSVPGILLLIVLMLVLLVAALLFLPVWAIFDLRYDQLTVRLRVLFLTFTVFPLREKKTKEKEQPPQEEQTEKQSSLL